jgi:hypothetical protein
MRRLVLLASCLALLAPISGAAQAPICDDTFHIEVEFDSLRSSRLESIDAISADDAWAVGYQGDPIHALTVHWDGDAWAVVDTPLPPRRVGLLFGVSGAAADAVWAVGRDIGAKWWQRSGLILFWDGTSWTQVGLPKIRGSETLTDVHALSRDHVWAVGTRERKGRLRTLTLHFDGSSWEQVPSPEPRRGDQPILEAVDGSSSSDVWAVGGKDVRAGAEARAVVMRWDGVEWDFVRLPRYWRRHNVVLAAIDASSPGGVWAAGGGTSRDGSSAVALRWDGDSWQDTTVPGRRGSESLTGITTTRPGDTVAVGYRFVPETSHTIAARWDGSSWSEVRAEEAGPSSDLADADAAGDGSVWAVGAGSHAVIQKACRPGLRAFNDAMQR